MLQLEKKLKRKYAKIFTVSSDDLVDVVDGIEDLLKKERSQPRGGDETAKFSATITITKADFTSVQSFLWNFMQKTAQDNFGFQQLAELQSLKRNIQVNEFDAHFTIVRRTFEFLANPPDDKTKALGPYLLDFLPQHLQGLQKATGLDELTPSEKREIGDGLFNLFVSGEVIKRHWDSCDTLIWYRSAEEVNIFLGWFADPSVTGHLRGLNREWLREIREDRNPNRALLDKVMKMVAWQWLQDEEREWDVSRPYEWIRGFLSMVCRLCYFRTVRALTTCISRFQS
jgi:hypothetical protein